MERAELSELESFKSDIKSLLETSINSIRDIIDHYTKTNEREHNEIREEQGKQRDVQNQIFETIKTSDKETDKKVTSVRVSLEDQLQAQDKRMDDIEKAPGKQAIEEAKKAKDDAKKIRHGIILGVVPTLVLMALLWLLQQVFSGGPPPVP